MAIHLRVFLVIVSGCLCSAATDVDKTGTSPVVVEVCQMEAFQASCAADEVILMQSSQLGRLKLGRCVIEVSHAYPLNCTLDVKPEMDMYCSGKRQCDIRIDDVNFRRPTPCPRDLKIHLWASYQCRKVTVPPIPCRQSGTSYVINAQLSGGGWLASQTTEDTGCGLTETPWIIQVGTGQRINVTMHDLSYDAMSMRHASDSSSSADDADSLMSSRRHQYPRTCRVFATIREPSRGTTSTVCGSQGRVVNVFTSDGDRIELRVMTSVPRSSTGLSAGAAAVVPHSNSRSATGGPSGRISRSIPGPSATVVAASGAGSNIGTSLQLLDPYFLVRYDVIGCADPVPSLADDKTIRRRTSPDTMTVSCVGSDSSWILNCVGNEWIGFNVANCSRDEVAAVGQPVYPVALSGIVVIIIAIFVSSVILLGGIICIKWRMKKDFVRRQRLCQADYDAAAYGLGSVMTSQGGGGTSSKSRMVLDASYVGGCGTSANGELIGGPQDVGSSTPGSRNEYARMRLQQQQQRLCSHYTGGPYGFESSVVTAAGATYGHPRHQFPSSPSAGPRFVEHIYESPDTLRRDNNYGPLDEHYTPTVPADGAAWGPTGTFGGGHPVRLPAHHHHHHQQQRQQHGCYPPSTPTPGVHQQRNGMTSACSAAAPTYRGVVGSPSKDASKNKNKNVGNYSL